MKSAAKNIDEYVAELPADRQQDIKSLVELVRGNMPAGYDEAMTWGMPTWEVPLSFYPDTYNKKPLMYVAVSMQKNYSALYLMSPYAIPGEDEAFRKAYKASGKKLDMGKGCVRFKKYEDLPIDVIATTIAKITPQQYIENYDKTRKK